MVPFSDADDGCFAKTWLVTEDLTDHYHCPEEQARRWLLDHESDIRSRLVQLRSDCLAENVPFQERDEPLLYGEPV